MTCLSLRVYRVFDPDEPPDRLAPGPRKWHKTRAQAVHEVLDENPDWKVSDWQKTDTEEAHEVIELILEFIGDPATAQTAADRLQYVGLQVLNASIGFGVVSAISRLLKRFRSKQESKEVTQFFIQVNNYIQVDPPDVGGRIYLNNKRIDDLHGDDRDNP